MIALIRSFKPVLFMMQLTIIGFGNQARAWAQNLKDSGFPLRVALRAGSSSFQKAREMGFEVVEIGHADFYQGEAFALLTPDDSHHTFLEEFATKLNPQSIILYAHGFSLGKDEFEKTYPKLRHILFAPKSIGSELRRQYELKGKLGAVYSLEHLSDHKKEVEDWLFELARSLGINLGPYKTSFKKETQADLYSEQGLLCSIVPYTAGEMFKHLVEAGVEPELAYFECWHELKLIVNAMVDKGPEGFYDLISPNALIGSEKGFKRLFNDDFKQRLKSLLTEIQNGSFDQEIETVDIPELRHRIKSRWAASPLMKTFNQINVDKT